MSLQCVLITGATSGVGKATAIRLADKGYQVVGTTSDSQKESLQLNSLDQKFPIVHMDLSSSESIDSGYEKVLNIFGNAPEIFIANAGIGEAGSVEMTPLTEMRRMFDINYFGHVQLIQKIIPAMRQNRMGKIIVLGSLVYKIQFPFKATYCASKSALSAFALSLRQELLPYGIRIHLLEPGWIRSGFHKRLQISDPQNSPYASRLPQFLNQSRDQKKIYPDGKRVANIILACIEKRKMPFRIIVGPDALLVGFLIRVLPAKWIDSILRKKIKS